MTKGLRLPPQPLEFHGSPTRAQTATYSGQPFSPSTAFAAFTGCAKACCHRCVSAIEGLASRNQGKWQKGEIVQGQGWR